MNAYPRHHPRSAAHRSNLGSTQRALDTSHRRGDQWSSLKRRPVSRRPGDPDHAASFTTKTLASPRRWPSSSSEVDRGHGDRTTTKRVTARRGTCKRKTVTTGVDRGQRLLSFIFLFPYRSPLRSLHPPLFLVARVVNKSNRGRAPSSPRPWDKPRASPLP